MLVSLPPSRSDKFISTFVTPSTALSYGVCRPAAVDYNCFHTCSCTCKCSSNFPGKEYVWTCAGVRKPDLAATVSVKFLGTKAQPFC